MITRTIVHASDQVATDQEQGQYWLEKYNSTGPQHAATKESQNIFVSHQWGERDIFNLFMAEHLYRCLRPTVLPALLSETDPLGSRKRIFLLVESPAATDRDEISQKLCQVASSSREDIRPRIALPENRKQSITDVWKSLVGIFSSGDPHFAEQHDRIY